MVEILNNCDDDKDTPIPGAEKLIAIAEQKKITMGLHGTKSMYLPEIINRGLRKNNSAIFMAPQKGLTPQELAFTLQVAIYHAISLRSQKEVLLNGGGFAQYFRENPGEMPAIVLFDMNEKTDLQRQNQESLACYESTGCKDLVTLPYTKIGDDPLMPSAIVSYGRIEQDDLERVEKSCFSAGMVLERERARTRFFVKCLCGYRSSFENEDLIDQKFMENFCGGLMPGLTAKVIENIKVG